MYTEVRWSDYAETGAVPTDTEDLINYPRAVAGVDIALVFIEQRDGQTFILGKVVKIEQDVVEIQLPGSFFTSARGYATLGRAWADSNMEHA